MNTILLYKGQTLTHEGVEYDHTAAINSDLSLLELEKMVGKKGEVFTSGHLDRQWQGIVTRPCFDFQRFTNMKSVA